MLPLLDTTGDLNDDWLKKANPDYHAIEDAAFLLAEAMHIKETMNTGQKGGMGSGNHGHAGRPGHLGGSMPGAGGSGLSWSQPLDKAGRPIPIQAKTVAEAARLVLQGKVVEVKDVRTAYTLVSKLARDSNAAKAAGKAAKNYDLCNVSVAGTNMFCGGNVGVPRLKMPQLSGVPKPGSQADKLPRNPWDKTEVNAAGQFTDYLHSIGIKTSTGTVPAAKLRASQSQLEGTKVAAMMTDAKFDPAKNPIFISRDNYVVDGHHRWAAIVGRDAADGHLGDSKMNVVRIDAPISEVLHIANKWSTDFGIQQVGIKQIIMLYGTKGGPGSGNRGHRGRPGHLGGSTPGTGAGGADVRQYSDAQIKQMLLEADAAMSLGGYAPSKVVDLSKMGVADRIAIMDYEYQSGDRLFMSSKRYEHPLRDQWDKFDADMEGKTGAEILVEGQKRGLLSTEKTGDFTYRANSSNSYVNAFEGLDATGRDKLEQGYVKIFSVPSANGGNATSSYAKDLVSAGWTTPELERFADRLQVAGGKSGYGSGIDIMSNHLSMYSKDYNTFRTGLFEDWSFTSNTYSAGIMRLMADKAFDSGPFFHAKVDNQFGNLFSPSRVADNIGKLKAETEAFYQAKFKTQDLSKKFVTLHRGVDAQVTAYTPASVESWSALPSTARKFASGGGTTLTTKVSYNDILWTWESAAGKPGWPAEADLKGKKEFVVLGSRIQNVTLGE